jgi:hypothetical protein
MSTEWFDQHTAVWFCYLSLFSLVSVLGYFVKQGRHRMLVTTAFGVCAGIGVLLLGASIIAAMTDQPRHVIFPFAFSGAVIGSVFAVTLTGLRGRYTAAELRRVASKEI